MSSEFPDATAAQLGKAPPSGPMVQRCPFCTLKTQGGDDGLAAHIRVIHPDRQIAGGE